MFDLDNWQEIFTTMKRNKLRSFLTGFAVAWGIFMLIILLGAGNGLKNGVTKNFGSNNLNTIHVWAGSTSKPYGGYDKGRFVRINDKELWMINNQLLNVTAFTPIIYRHSDISYGKESGSFPISGITFDYFKMNDYVISEGMGRFLNVLDEKYKNKSIVIHKRIKNNLFKNENPIGKQVIINKLAFTVVGVCEERTGMGYDNPAFIPFSTAKSLYNPNGYYEMMFAVDGLNTEKENLKFNADYRKKAAILHNYDVTDENTRWINNNFLNFLQTKSIFNAINIILWIIGISTLIGGIMGVSNIMLITVRERTKEFGIRKAIGAKPSSILRVSVMEATVITVISGYVGMLAGIGVTELISKVLSSKQSNEMTVFMNPTVSLSITISATILLIIAGIFAGYIPARKAVAIKPIEAIRYE